MTEFKPGDIVRGRIYGDYRMVTGMVESTDTVGDPYVRITDPEDTGYKIGLCCYLTRRETSVVPLKAETPRGRVLAEADRLIHGDRNLSYGEPTQNFTDIGTGWTLLLRGKLKDGEVVDPGLVAAMMIQAKLVRRTASDDLDHWVDMVGYAACGAEADIASGRIPAP